MATAPERGASAERRLVVTLPSDREIEMTRAFAAPRRLVFAAHSSPEHLKHWWGPRGFTMVSCEMDFRPGSAIGPSGIVFTNPQDSGLGNFSIVGLQMV